MNRYRTHRCGELRAGNDGEAVKLSGWLSAKRDHGGIFFTHIRDNTGITQVVIQTPEVSDEELDVVLHTHMESVIYIEGKVRHRPEGEENPDIKTGEIEVLATRVEVLSPAVQPPPFQLDQAEQTKEDLRLEYRFLDLRRDRLQRNIRLRDRFCQLIRESFSKHGFLEVHTPILSNSSPEGARDFLVPSRLHPGRFFALPQAPQQWKQLLMASGVDRYFQIAPCFRDEPARADRTPGEFYQIDLEMAFVEQEDVLTTIEAIMIEIAENFSDKKMVKPFPRMSYNEVIDRFGSDKPDLRFGFEMKTVTDVFRGSNVRYLNDTVERGDDIRILNVEDGGDKFSRKELDELEKLAKESGVPGMAWIIWTSDTSVKGTLAGTMSIDPEGDSSSGKISVEELAKVKEICGAENNTLQLVCAGPRRRIDTALSAVRHRIGRKLGLCDPDLLHFAWIVDFPMYELDEETNNVIFSHNPFSMPAGGLESLKTKDPLDIIGQQYDLVCNGLEISSGAIRNNIPEALYLAFEIAGYDRSVVDQQFGHMIKAFELGTPPHGGFAPGFERLLMIFLGEESIREVIPFPKNQKCLDLLVNAPNEVSEAQLRELSISIKKPKEKK